VRARRRIKSRGKDCEPLRLRREWDDQFHGSAR
jgi:hypothetical protein